MTDDLQFARDELAAFRADVERYERDAEECANAKKSPGTYFGPRPPMASRVEIAQLSAAIALCERLAEFEPVLDHIRVSLARLSC